MSDTSKRNKQQGEAKSILLAALKSALIAYLIAILLCLVASAVTIRLANPTSAVFAVSMLILYLSSFLAGFFCMRSLKEKALLSALSSSAMLICLNFISSLILPHRSSFSPSFALSLLLHALMIVFAFLGAHMGKKKPKKRKQKR